MAKKDLCGSETDWKLAGTLEIIDKTSEYDKMMNLVIEKLMNSLNDIYQQTKDMETRVIAKKQYNEVVKMLNAGERL